MCTFSNIFERLLSSFGRVLGKLEIFHTRTTRVNLRNVSMCAEINNKIKSAHKYSCTRNDAGTNPRNSNITTNLHNVVGRPRRPQNNRSLIRAKLFFLLLFGSNPSEHARAFRENLSRSSFSSFFFPCSSFPSDTRSTCTQDS